VIFGKKRKRVKGGVTKQVKGGPGSFTGLGTIEQNEKGRKRGGGRRNHLHETLGSMRGSWSEKRKRVVKSMSMEVGIGCQKASGKGKGDKKI